MIRKLSLAGAGVVAVLVAGGAVAYAVASPGSTAQDGQSVQLSPEKQALADEDAKYDAQQAAIADDPNTLASVVAEKERGEAALPSGDPVPVDDWPQGIFDDPEAPAPGSEFLGDNRWVGLLDKHSVAVYAGVAGDDPSLGRLLVMSAVPDDSGQLGYKIDLPGGGPLRVLDARGTDLVIADSHGGEHIFDVRAGEWTS
jgi:hypothetical protein